VKKGGHGRGNWGTEKKDGETEETKGTEEETTAEPREETKREEPVEEEVEYEEVGVSLDDFLAQKKANQKGLLAKAGGRDHEKSNLKGVEAGADVKRITTITTELSGAQVYAPKSEGAEFFGFSSKEDPVDGDRRYGGRGDRERRERTDRPARGGRGAAGGGRKGGKIVVDDNDFPTL